MTIGKSDRKRDIVRILMAGGGTGGHIYPAIAIAEAVREREPRSVIEFAGTRDRMEWDVVPKAGFAIHPIKAVRIRRKLSAENLLIPFKLLRAYIQSRRLIRGFDPHVVVGTGGYVSGPVLWTAARMGRPILIQEQNAYAGVTNKLLAGRADRIHIAFEEAKRYFPAERCTLSGNPTRTSLSAMNRKDARSALGIPGTDRVLFVFGGSLGSAAINHAMATCIADLLEDDEMRVFWQTGRLYFKHLTTTVKPHHRLKLLEYVDRMDLMYHAADLVVSRAGAITCSELMVTGAPSILIPSPNVAEDHQTKNARAMERGGAAVLLPESQMADGLVTTVSSLLEDEGRCEAMRVAALKLARPRAAEAIARDVLALAKVPAPREDGEILKDRIERNSKT